MSTAPKGTTHRQRKVASAIKPLSDGISDRRPCTKEELEGLSAKIAQQFGWKDGPKVFQMDAINAQLEMRDVLVHAGTGTGKTAIAAGPHVHPSTKGKVTIMVSPLIALHDEMVGTFQEEFKLRATAVNSSNGGCTTEKLRSIVKGDSQIILISPELLLSRRFIKEVLKNVEFKRRVLSVVIDEAHVISHWGAGFRKKYGELGIIRSFLLKSTPIVALSATLPARVRRDVLRVLRFDQNNFINIDIGNDRPNVSIVIRGIQHPLNTYADLDFVINKLAESPTDILKSFIYCDNIAMGTEIIDHLTDLLPEHLQLLGIIRPYNACFSKEYRRGVMKAFKEGSVRILVCTDAAGMGCNIPDIDLVVQWKLPTSVSAFVQRAGRAARARDRQGLAVLLVEPSAYSVMLNEKGNTETTSGDDKKKKKKAPPTTAAEKAKAKELKKTKQNHAKARGVRRGSEGGKHDAIFVRDCPPISEDMADEGLLSLVQSGICRRVVLSGIYGSCRAPPTAPCCDICCPELLNRTRPGKRPKNSRAKVVKRGEPCQLVVDMVVAWRSKIKARDFADSLFASDALVPDEIVDSVANVGPIQCKEQLSAAVLGQWGWEEIYGNELLQELLVLDIPPLIPLPTKPKAPPKRPVVEEGEQRAVVTKKPKKPVKAAQTPNDQSQQGAQPLFVIQGYTHSSSEPSLNPQSLQLSVPPAGQASRLSSSSIWAPQMQVFSLAGGSRTRGHVETVQDVDN